MYFYMALSQQGNKEITTSALQTAPISLADFSSSVKGWMNNLQDAAALSQYTALRMNVSLWTKPWQQ